MRIIKFTIFMFLILSFISCIPYTKDTTSTYIVGINPEDKGQSFYFVKLFKYTRDPWFAWEPGQSKLEPEGYKLVVKNGKSKKDIMPLLEEKIDKMLQLEPDSHDFWSNLWAAAGKVPAIVRALNKDKWFVSQGPYFYTYSSYEGLKILPLEIESFTKFVSDFQFIYATYKKNSDKIEDIDKIFIYNIKTGKKRVLDEFTQGFNEIPNIMNEKSMELSDFYENPLSFSYDIKNSKAFFIVNYNVEDFYNHTYLITFEKGKHWVKKKIEIGKNMSIENLTFFKNNLYVEVTNFKSKEHDGEVGTLKDGKIEYKNKCAENFIYYKGSLYGTDFQYQNVVKIAE